jgi:type IV secretion system protein TrbL
MNSVCSAVEYGFEGVPIYSDEELAGQKEDATKAPEASKAATKSNITYIITGVSNRFETATAKWYNIVLEAATRLFWLLGTISLAYTLGMGYIKGELNEIRSFFAYIIQFILFFGFYLWLLRNGTTIAADIINSMLELGAKMNGGTDTNSAAILTKAYDIMDKSLANFSMTTFGTSLFCVIASFMICILFAVIALNLLIEYCGGWILIYCGFFFLGFGATKWTSDMAVNYLKAVFGVGIRMLSMILIMGIGIQIIDAVMKIPGNVITWKDYISILITCLILNGLMAKIPSMLSNLIGGAGAGGTLGTGTAGVLMGVAAASGIALGSAGASGVAAAVGGFMKAANMGAVSSVGNAIAGTAQSAVPASNGNAGGASKIDSLLNNGDSGNSSSTSTSQRSGNNAAPTTTDSDKPAAAPTGGGTSKKPTMQETLQANTGTNAKLAGQQLLKTATSIGKMSSLFQ